MDIQTLLSSMIEKNASDLHLSSNNPPMIRASSEIIVLDETILSTNIILDMLSTLMDKQQMDAFMETLESDFSLMVESGRFRVNAFHNLNGVGATFRYISNTILSMSDLGLTTAMKDLVKLKQGLVLVTGPTGSGKSTTLASMLNEINQTQKKHIITIEDPIEFIHHRKMCLINQREVHNHTESFSVALRAALREDPDIILVGEMRDLETIKLALTAAETGHLVFGTLHTSSAVKTIDRIIDVFPVEEKDMVRSMISESLEAVISQTLVCKTNGGRCAAYEFMVATPAIKSLIRENKTPQMFSAIQTGSQNGMISLDQSLKLLLGKKIITKEEAAEHAKDSKSFI